MRKGEFLNLIADTEECVKDFGLFSVWRSREGKYIVATLDKHKRNFIIICIYGTVETAVDYAYYLQNCFDKWG